MVPVPRLGPQAHSEHGARGALVHIQNEPSDARAGALPDRPRTSRLLGCRPGKHGGASRPRAPSLAPWGILQLLPRRLVSQADPHSLRLLSFRYFGSPFSLSSPLQQFVPMWFPLLLHPRYLPLLR